MVNLLLHWFISTASLLIVAYIFPGIEVRGFGIVKLPWCPESRLGLAVALQPGAPPERLPEPETYDLLGVPLPLLRLDPRAPSAGAKIRLALVAERLP